MRLRFLSRVGWIAAAIAVCIVLTALTFVTLNNHSSESNPATEETVFAEGATAVPLKASTLARVDQTPPAQGTAPFATEGEIYDVDLACDGVAWWENSEDTSISADCFDALNQHYIDKDAATFGFSGASFGDPISFRKIFMDPKSDRERILSVARVDECWTEDGWRSQEERRQVCHADSFVNYGMLMYLCEQGSFRRSRHNRFYEKAMIEHWILAKCLNKDKAFEESYYSEILNSPSFLDLMKHQYGNEVKHPDFSTLLTLAANMGHKVALGLPVLELGLMEKHPWRNRLGFMALFSDEEFRLRSAIELDDIHQVQSLSFVLEVAVELQEEGVEPNWPNLLRKSQDWVTSKEDSLQEAIIELNNTLDPVDDAARLKALDKIERVAMQLGL